LKLEEGRILGLIDLGRDPWSQRDELMREACFIADVAVLPGWIRVSQLLDYVSGVHPHFDRRKAENFLRKTTIKHSNKVRELSKGMVTQLHLALVMAMDAKLLILDEPTLGLDILYRKQFYDSLLNDYFDGVRTIVVSTHEVEEVQHVLTDLIFIDRGHRVELQHGRIRGALLGGDGATRQHRRGHCAQADPSTPGFRPDHPTIRGRTKAATPGFGRGPYPRGCRPVRGRDEQAT
jgi:ABC-type multidrug transport system ATPase subunit